MKTVNTLVAASLAMLCAVLATAEEITSDEAKTAVAAWRTKFGALPNGEVHRVDTITDPDSGAKIHVVSIKGGGFVVTPADDHVMPVMAFSEEGAFDASPENPLLQVLLSDAAAARAAFDDSVQDTAAATLESPGEVAPKTDSSFGLRTEPQQAWDVLLGRATVFPVPTSEPSPAPTSSGSSNRTDTRVKPLLETEWGQTTHNGDREVGLGGEGLLCFNYYTPEWPEESPPEASTDDQGEHDNENNERTTTHYPCGCVATAGAQIMKKWEKPSGWSIGSMPTKPAKRTNESGRKAIGKLTRKIGEVCGASYGPNTLMNTETMVNSLTSSFSYKGAFWQYTSDADFTSSGDGVCTFDRQVIPNLIAGCPLSMKLVGHSVVIDGLKYVGSTRKIHVNFGWLGGKLTKNNTWYVPQTFKTSAGTYTSVKGIGLNIHPTKKQAIIAGRVSFLYSGETIGEALKGASVVLKKNGTRIDSTTTDAKGQFYFFADGATYSLEISCSGYSTKTIDSVVVNCSGSSVSNWYKEIWLIQTSAEPVATPSINAVAHDGSAYYAVTMSCATSGADIHYTIDGSEPDEDSPKYTAPFTLHETGTITLVAKAFKEGMIPSGHCTCSMTFAKILSNATFASAASISSPSGRITMNNASAFNESEEPVHSPFGNKGGASMWVSFTAPVDGDFTFAASGSYADSDESTLDTQLAVYTGTSLSSLGLVAANDDIDAASYSLSSQVSFSAQRGVAYMIAVDTSGGAKGDLVLEWREGREDIASPSEYEIYCDANETTYSVPIRSTAPWEVCDCSEWITVETSSGADGESVTFSLSPLGDETVRSGLVMLAAGDGPASAIIVVQGSTKWYTSRADAIAAAKSTGKRILLVGGRDTCSNTSYTRFTACEDRSVKSSILEGYVLWYSNCDTQSTEFSPYATGLGYYTLPVVAIIDPASPDQFVARTTGRQTAPMLKQFLLDNSEGKLPSVPLDVTIREAIGVNATTLEWIPARRASSYEVWRGTKWGIENASRIADGLLSPVFADGTAELGVLYYYRVRAVNGVGAGPFSHPLAVCLKSETNEPSDSFGRALGAPHLTWTSEGDYPWTVQGTNTYDGLATQSAFVSPTQSGVVSTLKTTVLGPTRMSFRFKTRMYASRFSVFVDDDEFFAHQGGSVHDWTAVEVAIPAGYHEVAFTYAKNGYMTGGFNGAYLDDIRFDVLSQTPTLSPSTTDAERTATAFVGSLSVSIGVPDGGSAFYTLDGSEPTVDSTLYTGPFTINGSTLAKAVCLQPGHDVSPVVSGLYLERHAVGPGEWTTDIDGAKAAALENGSLIVTLFADCLSCGYSRAFAEISESESFLAWARDNGVYLVTADDSRFPDTDAAYDHFRTLFNASGETGYIYYPALAISSAWAPNTPVCYAVARSGRDIGSVPYDGTEDSLEAALVALMETKPANRKVWRSCDLNYYPYTTTSNQVTCGSTIGTLTQPTRNGFTFGGWWDTSSSSGGRQYTSSSIAPYEDFTLYARWFANYTVKFNANGGTGSMSNQSFVRGTPQALRVNSFKRTGYGFAGWSKSASGNAVFTDGQVVSDLTTTGNGTVTLYAVWLPVDEDGSWVTITTEVPVPYSWLDKYGLCEDFGPETAAVRPSGKTGADGALLPYWHDYVAGTDPTNMNSKFEAQLRFDGENPVVEWTPDLNEGGKLSKRRYTVQGKEKLDDAWGSSNSSSRFFRVKVEMP